MCPARIGENFRCHVPAAGHLRWLVAQELLLWPLQKFGVSGDGGLRLWSAQVCLCGRGFEEGRGRGVFDGAGWGGGVGGD
jgi:hypothetical protein